MEHLTSYAAWISAALNLQLVSLGEVSITAGSLLKLLVLMTALFWFAGAMRRWMVTRLLRHFDANAGTRIAIASVLRYLVLVLGMMLIMQNVGIKLSALSVVAGAIGVGVGFGLQNIVSNFISGLIVMLERPVKVGDRIEVGAIEGVVREISARRTTVVTADNVAVLIPNQRLILENVVNADYLNESVRLRITVVLVAETELALLEQILRTVAAANPHVLATPAPEVLMSALEGSNCKFELAVWYCPGVVARDRLTSELNIALSKEFAAHGVRHA
ncbi:mechanosensitive ion channel family protein [Comamonas sp. NLF-1-9]|uniref:mechanosensitive ion channel family protein n=1 Tax=Comamonas sp. NLF-1-9 TaxID=2853163 RepID=UPI001C4638DA|nr:mechanosensitive ion channel domain-containing protein [Comamonas sp. NLF-1-9]QXL85298.1 mechanosensitive ion channel [Comamonas sp. NLF-1-9]